MAADAVVKIMQLDFTVDPASASKANKAIDAQRRVLSNLQKEEEKINRTARESVKVTNLLSKENLALVKATKAATAAAREENSVLDARIKKTRELEAELTRVQEASRDPRTRGGLGALQDITGTAAGAGGALGRQRLEQIVPGGGTALAGAESLEQLFGAANAIPEAVLGAKIAMNSFSLSILGVTIAAAPLLIVMGGLATIAVVTTQKLKESQNAMESAVDARKAEIEAITELTSEQIEERIKALETEQEQNRLLAEDFKKAQQGVGKFLGTFTGVNKQLKEAEQAATSNAAEIDALTRALNSAEVAAKDTAVAEEELLAKRIALTELQLSAELSTLISATKLTKEAAQEQIEQLQKELEVREKFIEESELTAALLERETNEIERLNVQIKTLTEALPGLADAAEDTADEAKKTAEEIKKTEERQAKEVARIKEQAAKRTIAIEERLSDQLEAIAVRRAQDAEDALTRESERLTDLRTDRVRDEADAERDLRIDNQQAIVEAQRDEVKAAQDQVRSLKRIREDAAVDEKEAALRGDFAAIARSRRSTRTQLQRESENFNAERKERATALRQELEDNAVGFLLEREQRLIEEARKLADLKLQASREAAQRKKNEQRRIEAVNAAAVRELSRLQDKLEKELELKQKVFEIELELLSEFASRADEILDKIEKRDRTRTRREAEQREAVGTGVQRQFGGPLSAGQTSKVNEKVRESFTSGGRTMDLPDGMGLFTPSRAGTVNPVSGAGTTTTITIPMTISGVSDPVRAAEIADERISASLTRIFDK